MRSLPWPHVALRDRALAGQAGFLLVVALTGAGMGLVAVGFRELLRTANRLFFGSFHGLDLTATLFDRPYVALVPAAGGLLVGLYLRWVLRRPAGHGVSEVIVAVETRGGRLPWVSGLHTAFGSVVTIGSGGSAGPEGPIIQIGAALASSLGQALRLPEARLRTLLACGAAAGLAGMYHAPLTGAAFASEVLLEELEPRRFSLLALAAVIGTAVAQQFSVERIIQVGPVRAAPWQDIPLDIGLGLLAAPFGVALLLAVHALDRSLRRLRLPFWLGPALGGLAVGALGLALPRVLGSGDTGIEQALAGKLALGLLLVLPLAKLAATSITLGSGATGGVFTPSLFIGATLGGAFGAIVRHAWSGASPVPAYALVGMGTVVAAVVNAPLTAVLLVCELTGDFTLLPQVVVAVAASVMFARRLHAESIYTVPLRLYGIDRALNRRSPLSRVRVREALIADWPTVAPDLPLHELLTFAGKTGRTLFPIVGESGRFAGLVELEAALSRQREAGPGGERQIVAAEPVAILARHDLPLVDPEETLHDVALLLAGAPTFLAAIPVVSKRDERYAGMLERSAILRSYSAAARLHERVARRGDGAG